MNWGLKLIYTFFQTDFFMEENHFMSVVVEIVKENDG